MFGITPTVAPFSERNTKKDKLKIREPSPRFRYPSVKSSHQSSHQKSSKRSDNGPEKITSLCRVYDARAEELLPSPPATRRRRLYHRGVRLRCLSATYRLSPKLRRSCQRRHPKRTLTKELATSKYKGTDLDLVELLNFSSQSLTSVSESFAKICISLQHLSLSDNQLTSLAPFANFPVLRKLDVASNNISTLLDLPSGSFRLLEWLDISYNLISICSVFSSASILCRLPRLKYLKAAGNDLRKTPSLLGMFSQLTELQLENNNLEGRDLLSFASLHNLKYLNVARNKIQSIPDEMGSFGSFPKLIALDLSSNGLTCDITVSLLHRLPLLSQVKLRDGDSHENKDKMLREQSDIPFNCLSDKSLKTPADCANCKHAVERETACDSGCRSELENIVIEPLNTTLYSTTFLPAVHWAWEEIDDPTVKTALQLGLHPKYIGCRKSSSLSFTALKQLPSRQQDTHKLQHIGFQFSRPTISFQGKLKY